MDEFKSLSGLSLNKSKTQIMIIGKSYSNADANEIERLGFKHSTELKILGITLDENLSKINKNWDNVITKICAQINYWRLRNPSLTSKIDIVKTFFISQISYIASSLPISDYHANKIEEQILSFLFSKERIFPKTRTFYSNLEGGLGTPKLNHYVMHS